MYALIILDKFLKVVRNALKRVFTHSKNGANFGDRCVILDSILGQFRSSWWISTHKTPLYRIPTSFKKLGFRYPLSEMLLIQ